ncbi:PP2C family protein-serine/threonine phosphatase [Bifidobacterium felsineum]|uniref:Protein phosphatase n=1 Tax=Bifidobacterium felsineum TaxID=2045440 RepID=A0A2M9HJI7_9BIFI|nr:serine/threonine-protein phosphatase [Bifidobacterium felsineum]MBT1164297.1 serine/threonine-protein phosphatase [Bifidobacterium felsineum]PJM76950.1 protein phosphatase [Bifidobacterium felsineum]
MITGFIRAAMTSDPGLRRRNNQDAGLARQGVYLVCDGMGGGLGGEQASQLAVQRFATLSDSPVRNRRDIQTALHDAHRQILNLGQRLGGVAGTTISGLVLPHIPTGNTSDMQQTYVVNIGDSRVYHLSPKHDAQQHSSPQSASESNIVSTPSFWDASSLIRITRDHSQRQEAIDAGLLTPQDAEVLIPRNIITQCLGDPDGIDADIYVADLTGRYIICSDGLYGEVSDNDIAGIAATHANPQDAAHALVKMALDAGGRDNITVIVADMPVAESAQHDFSAFRLGDGEDLGDIDDTTLQTLRTIRAMQS